MNSGALAVALVSAAGCAQAAALPVIPEMATRAPVDAYPERRVTFPGGVTGLPDLTCRELQGYRPLKLDLYLPPPSFNSPPAGHQGGGPVTPGQGSRLQHRQGPVHDLGVLLR